MVLEKEARAKQQLVPGFKESDYKTEITDIEIEMNESTSSHFKICIA